MISAADRREKMIKRELPVNKTAIVPRRDIISLHVRDDV
jgi:hypothetical protein